MSITGGWYAETIVTFPMPPAGMSVRHLGRGGPGVGSTPHGPRWEGGGKLSMYAGDYHLQPQEPRPLGIKKSIRKWVRKELGSAPARHLRLLMGYGILQTLRLYSIQGSTFEIQLRKSHTQPISKTTGSNTTTHITHGMVTTQSGKEATFSSSVHRPLRPPPTPPPCPQPAVQRASVPFPSSSPGGPTVVLLCL